jgi:hypothetical protein
LIKVEFIEQAVVPYTVEGPRDVEKNGVGRVLPVEASCYALHETKHLVYGTRSHPKSELFRANDIALLGVGFQVTEEDFLEEFREVG